MRRIALALSCVLATLSCRAVPSARHDALSAESARLPAAANEVHARATLELPAAGAPAPSAPSAAGEHGASAASPALHASSPAPVQGLPPLPPQDPPAGESGAGIADGPQDRPDPLTSFEFFRIPSTADIEKATLAELARDRPGGLASADDKSRALQEVEGRKDFFGLSLGIAPSALIGGKRAVKRARIDTSGATPVVRVEEEARSDVAVLLETHYFFATNRGGTRQFGHGPFMSLKVGDGEVVDGLGFGYMAGWRTATGASSRSFNIGIGPFLDRKVQTLASGFHDGQAPPTGATEVQFRERDVWRFALTFSFSWGF